MPKVVSQRQMFRIREKQVLKVMEEGFGYKPDDTFPKGSTVKGHVRELMANQAIQSAAAASFEEFTALGGDEQAWVVLAKTYLNEDPEDDAPEPSRIVMPAGVQQAMAFQEKVSHLKNGGRS